MMANCSLATSSSTFCAQGWRLVECFFIIARVLYA
jgi:hypothetical protein